MKDLASIPWFATLVLLCGCGGSSSRTSNPSPTTLPPPNPGYTVLHAFKGGEDGAGPLALIRDEAGNLYGTTVEGGDLACPDDPYGCGTVFKLDPSGTLTTLHVFAGRPADGANPQTSLVRDDAGNLYGGTFGGGAHQSGVVFKLDPTGNETVLYHFDGVVEGSGAEVGVRDAAGNLYGTTEFNPFAVTCTQDCGIVFKLDASGNLTILHKFSGSDGDSPGWGPLIRDIEGNLYGVTQFGGGNPACPWQWGCGIVFKLDPSGNFTTLHAFAGFTGDPGDVADGQYPTGRLAQDGAGNLYGTTFGGGEQQGGTVFSLDASGKMTILHAFVNAAQENDPYGQAPQGGVVLGPPGKLYGTTSDGGRSTWGVVFELDIESGEERVLHTLIPAGGGVPLGPLVWDGAANLYGTGSSGGDPTCDCGTVANFLP